jgi:hypothetical protein
MTTSDNEMVDDVIVESPKLNQYQREDHSSSPMADNEGTSSSEDESSEIELTDRPLTKRNRKSVERLASTYSPPKKPSTKGLSDSGDGMRLGEISKFEARFSKVQVQDDAVKRLHRILYGTDGQLTTRKRQIRLWNGTNNEATKASMMNGIGGAKSVSLLRDIASMLGVSGSGDRAGIERRLFEFLVKPTGSSSPIKKSKMNKKQKVEKTKGKKKTERSTSSSSSGFSKFLLTRMAEVLKQAGGTMSAKDVTELLTMEWKHMSASERSQYEGKKPKADVSPSPKKGMITSEEESSSSSSSSSSSDSSSSSEDDE